MASIKNDAPKGFFSSSFSFRHLDIYTKLEDDYKVQTSGGALLSLIGWAVISILALGEVRSFLTPKISEHMKVDFTLGQELRVNLNISFHALTCAQVHVDAMDVSGDNQVDIETQIFKQRITASGGHIGDKLNDGVGKNVMTPLNPVKCGSCYGAESERLKCCNTCSELKRAYNEKGWSLSNVMESEQCQREAISPFYEAEAGEGCQVSGTLRVNKVAGNFHIAHGESVIRDGRHIHQFNPADAPFYNISHSIHSLSFGDTYPNMPISPLDGVTRIVQPEVGTGLYQYYIRIIPTEYTDKTGLGNKYLFTNEYTVSEKFRPFFVATGSDGSFVPAPGTVLPGMFFVYEMSPFLKEVRVTGMPIAHLFTKLCAIVGGVFTVLGVLDTLVFRLQRMCRRKT